jgi:hypothetical protein
MDEAKCPCKHCKENVAFPADMAGQIIECPHCGKDTILSIPKKRDDYDSNDIVKSLESIGEVFWVLGVCVGIFGCGLCAFALIVNNQISELQTEGLISGIVFGAIAFAQGFILKALFKGAAEIIRLLRKIAAK